MWNLFAIIPGNIILSLILVRVFSRDARRRIVKLKQELSDLHRSYDSLYSMYGSLHGEYKSLFYAPHKPPRGNLQVFKDTEMYVVRDSPENPKGAFVVMGTPNRMGKIDVDKHDVQDSYGESILNCEGRECPFVKVGDIFLVGGGYRIKVVELVFGDGHYAICDAFRALKLIRGSDYQYYHPATDIEEIDCSRCPILTETER